MEQQDMLRAIPKVDELLGMEPLQALAEQTPAPALREAVREELEALRRRILAGDTDHIPNREDLCAAVCRRAREASLPSLRGVVNGTGVTLHTNLGRACLSRRAVEAVVAVAGGYSTLEYDVDAGRRGSRHSHVEALLCAVTGAEGAMVVNNNAAAVLLILSALGKGGEVITSRGELVEIGGKFRIPDVMEQSGAVLVEVGTTNKTHYDDYKNAITEETKALLKVHTSNYRIVGFTESVEIDELITLAKEHDLPIIEDLGSGVLVDLAKYGLTHEPMVQESIAKGADVVCFSGDKLLGGPQAGIIVGKKKYKGDTAEEETAAEAPAAELPAGEVHELKAFLTGKAVPIEEVPDAVFSSKTLGDGMAIDPVSDVLTAPADGTVTIVMEGSNHACGLRFANGMEILLHIGLDTVAMNGDGFEPLVKVGDVVKAGDPLIRFSQEKIKAAGHPAMTIMVVTEMGEAKDITFLTGSHVDANASVIAKL